MHETKLTRREAMVAGAGAGLILASAWRALAADHRRLFKIGACDWSIQRRGDVQAMEQAAKIGLDGVQVTFGPPGEKYDLREEAVRKQYQEAARKYKVEISSLAMGVLNSIPYATEPSAQQWVAECIEVMPKMRQNVVLLAFFGKGDIGDRRDLQDKVIRNLKQVAPKAEKAGVVLGIESTLNADDHLRILDAVGSPAVQVYYDVANMHGRGYDIYQEIRRLGRNRICEIHCKESGALLGQGPIDFRRVKEAIDDIGWIGWLIIEGAVPKGMDVVEAYVQNQKFLRSIFPTARKV
jgi:sugar phosphate isomerase/epimerase